MLFLPGLAVGQQDFRPGPQIDIDPQTDQKADDGKDQPAGFIKMGGILDGELEDEHQGLDRNRDQNRRDEPRQRPAGRAMTPDVFPQ